MSKTYTYYVVIFTEQDGYIVKEIQREEKQTLATNRVEAVERALRYHKKQIVELNKQIQKLEILKHIEEVRQE